VANVRACARARAQRVDFADFSGLRPGSCSVSTTAREASFYDVLGAQLVAKVRTQPP
jgi:glyceraldehyde-3-phosphate dehydrogenase (NADP+) (phosphorylating)